MIAPKIAAYQAEVMSPGDRVHTVMHGDGVVESIDEKAGTVRVVLFQDKGTIDVARDRVWEP